MLIKMLGREWEVEARERIAEANRLVLQQPTILIVKARRSLTLLNGTSAVRTYPVALGKPSTPTPLGNFAVATKIPHPGGVLGSRWMGLNFDAYGIHGTNRPWLIGQLVSNGCIRMHNEHVEEVFNLIRLGTPVYIRDEG
ncbi:MAG: L,D-transpeptidase [Sporomusaceae bacterium]|nr:L,D-transpeptidase [Sporomusaceae bacterium]